MSYYFVANIKIHDQNEYNKYLEKIYEVFSRYNGKYLAVDKNPKIIEGDWNYSRIIIIEFNSKSDFNDFYYSKDYQEILKHRLISSECNSLLVKGKNADTNV